jgi:hypothetical protein
MIIKAVIALNDRYGLSRQAIYNYLVKNFPNVNITKCKIYGKTAIDLMITKGVLIKCARSLQLSPQFKLTQEYKSFINSAEIKKSPSEFQNNSVGPSEFKISYSKYQYYVINAIKCLKDRNGTSIPAINSWILANIIQVSYSNTKKVFIYGVKPLVSSGHLYKIKNSYKINKTCTNLVYFDTDVILGKIPYIERESTPFIPNEKSFKIGVKPEYSTRYTNSKYQKVVYNILEQSSSKNGLILEKIISKAIKILGQNDKFIKNKIKYLGINVLLKYQNIVICKLLNSNPIYKINHNKLKFV